MCAIRMNLNGLAAVCEHCKDRIVRVYHVYKDQWDSFLEENLQPIVNAAISMTVYAVSCSESLTVTMVAAFTIVSLVFNGSF